MRDNLEIFLCPACGGDLEIRHDQIHCLKCRRQYAAEGNIPLLFLPNEWDTLKGDVTDTVKSFYEKTPFPNYDGFENAAGLIEKARKSVFARLLDEQTPFNIRVLEVGCGTGQMTNFLSIASRTVFGTDMCLNSLKLAEDFRARHSLSRAGFYQMNLFRPVFREESFSLVICNGVLHHTSDPHLGFQSIAKLVKRGGYIVIGLYNKYGRLTADILRAIFDLSERFKYVDRQIKKRYFCDVKKHALFLDQYKNPHESRHTIGEVLRWFEQVGFEFINSIPKSKAFKGITEDESLFKQSPRSNLLDRFLTQTKLIFTGRREGGFFLMIGRKR